MGGVKPSLLNLLIMYKVVATGEIITTKQKQKVLDELVASGHIEEVKEKELKQERETKERKQRVSRKG